MRRIAASSALGHAEMNIASLNFLAFAAVAAIFYNVGRALWWRQLVLLVANLCFLATFSLDIAAYLPMIGFLAAGFAAVRALQTGRAAHLFWLLLAVMIGVFFWLKQYSFLPTSIFIAAPYVTIGLSYMFFRVIHLIIDAHSDNLPSTVEPIGYLNYVVNFTSLVSGPIQRYQDFAAMQLLPSRPELTLIVAGRAVERVIVGFFKVIIVAAILSTVHLRSLATLSADQPLAERAATALIVTASYTFYLYFNFSGYTDIVIGIARFLRLVLPENFNRPFSATSFLDLWSRWHITLSGWLKTYVYNPLVMSLMGRFPSPSAEPFLGVVGFFVTFFLIGLWHGQTPVFAVYGVLLGLGVSGNKLYQIAMTNALGRKAYRALTSNPLYEALARGLTFTWFTTSLICFWATGDQIRAMMASLRGGGAVVMYVMMIPLATIALAVVETGHGLALGVRIADRPVVLSRYVRTVWATAIAAIVIAVVTLLAAPAPDIVYKNF
jgi:alginate O-acetyltransferase complex protein AlgI